MDSFVFTRHSSDCKFKRDRFCRRCNCPKWVEGRLIAGWHFKSGRGYLGWGVTGVSLMVISGLGRMAEGFITQAQGIQ